MSVKLAFDRSLVIGESAIDCLSYEVLFPGNRYASIAGGLNPDQPTLIAAACRDMPTGSEIVCITHPDADGGRYAETIRQCSPRPSGFTGLMTSKIGMTSYGRETCILFLLPSFRKKCVRQGRW